MLWVRIEIMFVDPTFGLGAFIIYYIKIVNPDNISYQ
ncbi:hypothetical protein, partial [Plasmodium yoelii yoelii]